MSQTISTGTLDNGIFYPESDGKPMAENTEQSYWIRLIMGEVEAIFEPEPMVFVAGDLLWYPVQGKPRISAAPDTMVVFGRPKGKRFSYIQHLEGGIAPQVCFEIRSQTNDDREMEAKLKFYNTYDVEEYYIYDPENNALEGWLRRDGKLTPIAAMSGWISPRLKIRFEFANQELTLYRPDGRRFLPHSEHIKREEQERHRAEEESERAERERLRAERESLRAEQANLQAELEHQQAERERTAKERAWARLRELGEDPGSF